MHQFQIITDITIVKLCSDGLTRLQNSVKASPNIRIYFRRSLRSKITDPKKYMFPIIIQKHLFIHSKLSRKVHFWNNEQIEASTKLYKLLISQTINWLPTSAFSSLCLSLPNVFQLFYGLLSTLLISRKVTHCFFLC